MTVRTCLVVCALAIGAGSAEARPSVTISGIEVATDSVGIDVEAVGVARGLTQGLRRAADRPDGPMQRIDPMVRADDVEALVWGKLVPDGDTWVATVHLSPVGSAGDTVSYRATIRRAQTSSVELDRWGVVIYQSLLEQIVIDDKPPAPAPTPPPSLSGAPAGAPPPGPATTGEPADPFALREPPATVTVEVEPLGDGAPPAAADAGPQFARDRPWSEPRGNPNARRLFWVSAGVAGAAALMLTYSAVRISDAENQLERLSGCSNCDRAIEAANAQGNRWEGVSWLAGTATVAGVAATALFGYQAFVVGRRPAPGELVGGRAWPPHARSVVVTPVVAPDRIGAGVTVAF